ncbi:MAG: hypothetical protein ACRDOO_18095 [Actinomadura sp.]
MPGFLFHAGAVVNCPHAPGVAAIPMPTQQQVLVSGAPVAVAADEILVTGCALSVSGSTPPCTKVAWVNVSGRVLISGRPALLQAPPGGSGNGTCVGPPPPAIPLVMTMQSRVTAS